MSDGGAIRTAEIDVIQAARELKHLFRAPGMPALTVDAGAYDRLQDALVRLKQLRGK